MNEYYQDFLKLGYSETEAEELAILTERYQAELPEVNPEELMKIIEAFNDIPLVNPISPEELRSIL